MSSDQRPAKEVERSLCFFMQASVERVIIVNSFYWQEAFNVGVDDLNDLPILSSKRSA